MKELTLQELKEIEFEILKTFDSFCKENNIRYYLSHGTLLGAVRYKKFIPWDDDVDLLIPREDYNRMITLFKDTEKYKLFAFEKDENYLYPFAKLCDMTTYKDEFGYTLDEIFEDSGKGEYPYFMLKEIMEEKAAIRRIIKTYSDIIINIIPKYPPITEPSDLIRAWFKLALVFL